MTNIENVSRETLRTLQSFCAEAEKWNKSINLVSKATVPDFWLRHIVDSVQVIDCVEKVSHWIDIGSGGGFPGVVCAIVAADRYPEAQFSLIESDIRKAAFLRHATQKYALPCEIHAVRIENYSGNRGDVVSARALKALPQLLQYTESLLAADGVCLFPKGRSYSQEIIAAQESWSFDCNVIPSKTSPDAAVLRIENVNRNG